jgi:hypothetical protein
MNERIQKLIEQARVQDRGYFIYQYGGPNGHQSVEKAIDLEKFAELIVKECAEICLEANDHKNILRHFGVEL